MLSVVNVWLDSTGVVDDTRLVVEPISFTPDEWKTHYGDQWDGYVAAKRKYDPDGLLNPGFVPLAEAAGELATQEG